MLFLINLTSNSSAKRKYKFDRGKDKDIRSFLTSNKYLPHEETLATVFYLD